MKTLLLVLGLVAVIASGCDDERHLEAIEVSLANSAVYADGTTQATAMGTYSDGAEEDITTDVTWSSSNTAIGDVDIRGGVFAGMPGRTTIGATLDGEHGEAEFTVLDPILESILITGPSQFVPNGLFLQLGATGHYNDGSTRAITNAVTWSTDATTIATIDSTGKLAGHTVGGTTVHATQGAITADLPVSVTAGVLVTLAITPNPVPALPKGLTTELHATGTFSDGVENDVTEMVVWATDAPTIVTVNSTDDKGLVTSVATTGATNVHATYNASHGTFTDTVTVMAAPAVIVRVEIDPETLMLPLGRQDDLTCTGVYSDATEMDITDLATWDSADGDIIGVDNTTNKGHVTANLSTTGTTQVSCSYLTFDDTIDVEAIAAVLDHVDVTPQNANVLIHGDDVQYTASGLLSNGLPTAVTCTWDAPGAATISTSGLLDADSVVAGPGTVTWTCDGISGTNAYTAYATTTLELVVDDAFGSSVAVGGLLRHHAVAHTSGPDFDVTTLATYDTPTPVTIQVGTNPGQFTAIAAGPGTARATFDGKIATRNVTVTP